MFTGKNTINELFSDPLVRKYFKEFGLSGSSHFLSEADMDRSLDDLYTNFKMPWGLPFPSDTLIRAANLVTGTSIDELWESIPLWEIADPDIKLNMKASDKQSVCLQIRKDKDIENRKPAVIVCPGGGYTSSVSYSEGIDMAEKMASAGYRCFILNYRVKPNHYPAANIDLTLAIQYIRANADLLGADPDDLMVMGSSAGGHLCSMQGVNYHKYEKILREELHEISPVLDKCLFGISARPDKICLNYPLLSYLDIKEVPGLIDPDYIDASPESLKEASLETYSLEGFPKTYMWICADDSVIKVAAVEKNASLMQDYGVDLLFHLYPTGEHGCGRAFNTSAEGWMDEMIGFMNLK